jgi:hypothetical protein
MTFAVAGFAENLNQHSAAINSKLDSEFEDWEFFADDVDKRVRGAHCRVQLFRCDYFNALMRALQLECLFQQGQSSGLKVFIAACMREAGVMVLTHQDVSETSPSLLAALPRPASSSVHRSISVDSRAADAAAVAVPLKVQAPPAAVFSSQAKAPDIGQPPPVSAASTTTFNAAAASAAPVAAAFSAAPIASPPVASAQQSSKSTASNLTGKSAQEKSDAEAEKQMLLTNASALASPDIRLLIADTEQKLAYLASQASLEIRKQALVEAISAMKGQLTRRLAIETEEREVIEEIQRECKMQLSKHLVQARLTSDKRAESRSSIFSYMSLLESCLNDFKKVDSPLSVKVREVTQLLQDVSARAIELQDFENRVETKLNEIKAVKAQLSANQLSVDDAISLGVQYQQILTQEETPEIREAVTAVSSICTQLERVENEAVAFVQAGSNLKKFAREKLLKKNRHDPVSSLVKIASGNTLLWGSHKVGPRITDMNAGPSQLLVESGILGPR